MNAMGGTNLHRPQSIFQHTMNHQNLNPQNESQWFTMPQVPSISMQWSIPSVEQPDLVRFTGQRPSEFFKRLGHHKRKMETPDVIDTWPNKQFITEEKMAQHFQGLHISSSTFNTQDSGSATPTVNIGQNLIPSNDLDMNLPNSINITENNAEPRLVISDEIKRINQEPLLPKSLLSKLERPSMALVLWEPPSKHLRILPTLRDTPSSIQSSEGNNNGSNSNNIISDNSSNNSGSSSSNNNNNNGNNNNNNNSIPNLNQTMDLNVFDQNLEPMDL